MFFLGVRFPDFGEGFASKEGLASFLDHTGNGLTKLSKAFRIVLNCFLNCLDESRALNLPHQTRE